MLRTPSAMALGACVFGTAYAAQRLIAPYAGLSLALYCGIAFSTLLGFGAWAWLLGRHPASTVAPFTLLVPVVGIAAAWVALGEAPSAAELIGAAVVLGGLALTVGLTRPHRARRPADHALTSRRLRPRRSQRPPTGAASTGSAARHDARGAARHGAGTGAEAAERR